MEPFNIRGIFIAAAIVVGFYVTLKKAESKGLDSAKSAYVSFFAILGALIGARIYYLLFNESSHHSIASYFSLSFWYGGTGSSGAWIGGILTATIAFQIWKINVWRYLDSCTMAIAFGILIGRLGCFLKGCCFGTPTYLPWAVNYTRNSLAYQAQIEHQLLDSSQAFTLPIHPVQLYEAAYSLILLIITIVFWKRFKSDGQAFLVFAVLYPGGRFLFEFIRGDYRPFVAGISIPQLIYSVICGIAFISYLIMRSNAAKRPSRSSP